jgi:predicted DNA-binding protein (MmcQ/YjbR family)
MQVIFMNIHHQYPKVVIYLSFPQHDNFTTMSVEALREYCLSLPGATEDIKYGTDLCFSVCNKIFCGTRREGAFRTAIKCTAEVFAEVTARDGIVPMPRLSVICWIRIEKSNALSKKEWKEFINTSYQLIVAALPKKRKKR